MDNYGDMGVIQGFFFFGCLDITQFSCTQEMHFAIYHIHNLHVEFLLFNFIIRLWGYMQLYSGFTPSGIHVECQGSKPLWSTYYATFLAPGSPPPL